MTVQTFAVGVPGGRARWYQAEAAPTQLATGAVALPFTPVDGEPLPQAMISVDGTSIVSASDLDLQKAPRAAEADAFLKQALGRSCTTSIGIVQCDQDATDDIAAKVVSAIAAKLTGNAAWRQAWRLTDNSWSAPLTADQMIAFAQQVEAHVQACRLACWAAKDAVTAAPSITALAAIDITAGYPA